MKEEKFNPYGKSYNLKAILEGLRFYYEFLDLIDIGIYSEDKFPFSRGEILTTIMHLESVPSDHIINNLVHSHPTLEEAIESIPNYKALVENEKELNLTRYIIIIWLEHLLFTSCHMLFKKIEWDYLDYCKDKNPKQTLTYLFETQAYYKKNEGTYSRRISKLVLEFLEIEITKNKNIQSLNSNDSISDEVNDLIESYLSQINSNAEKNDLLTPLKQNDFEQFVFKLKRHLFIPSYYDISENDRKKAFHIYLLGVLTGRLNEYKINSNKESGLGRYDICLSPIDKRNPGVIIEFKKIEKAQNTLITNKELEDAFKQITTKNYSFELKEEGVKTILDIAIVFDGMNPTLDWRLE